MSSVFSFNSEILYFNSINIQVDGYTNGNRHSIKETYKKSS